MISCKRDIKLGKSLRRRGEKGIFWLRCQCNGKKIERSTGKTEPKPALEVAWQMVCEALGITTAAKIPLLRNTYPRVSEVTELYTKEIVLFGTRGCSSDTARACVNCLYRILREGLNVSPAAVGDLPIDKFSPETIQAWYQYRYTQAGATGADYNNLQLNLSLNSILRQARSVFGRSAMDIYDKHNLRIPHCIAAVARMPKLQQKKQEFVPIESSVDDRIKQLARTAIEHELDANNPLADNAPTPEQAVCIELARIAGLTRSEIAAICWDWIVPTKSGDYVIDIRYRPADGDRPQFISKKNTKYGRVPIRARYVESWRAALKPSSPKETIVKMDDPFYREVNAYLAPFLPDREKKLHELRKMAGSEFFSRDGSIARAAAFLRDSIETARKHYVSDLAESVGLD